MEFLFHIALAQSSGACQGNPRPTMHAFAAPVTVEDFEARLVEVADGLPKRLRQCAEFVSENPERIAVSTVAELAAAAGVQPSAFVRFCQILGFSGFSEMQRLFRDAYAPRWPDYRTRIDSLRSSGQDRPAALLAEFVEAGRHSLESLAKSVDYAALDAAVDILAAARVVHVAGFRRSFPAASYMAYAFEKMAIPAMLHGAVGHVDARHAILPGDALAAITFAPYTGATLDLAAHARHAGVPVVAVTDGLKSPLRRLDVTALTVTEIDVGSFRALSATLSLALTLVVATGARRAEMEKSACGRPK